MPSGPYKCTIAARVAVLPRHPNFHPTSYLPYMSTSNRLCNIPHVPTFVRPIGQLWCLSVRLMLFFRSCAIKSHCKELRNASLDTSRSVSQVIFLPCCDFFGIKSVMLCRDVSRVSLVCTPLESPQKIQRDRYDCVLRPCKTCGLERRVLNLPHKPFLPPPTRKHGYILSGF